MSESLFQIVQILSEKVFFCLRICTQFVREGVFFCTNFVRESGFFVRNFVREAVILSEDLYKICTKLFIDFPFFYDRTLLNPLLCKLTLTVFINFQKRFSFWRFCTNFVREWPHFVQNNFFSDKSRTKWTKSLWNSHKLVWWVKWIFWKGLGQNVA